MAKDFDIETELKKLPKSPGVYLMHDADDVIIYIGKAVNLFNRVHSYFRKTAKSEKIKRMVSQIVWFEYILTDSELEALVLENNLIKEHRPKYNTMLKDDKTYPYIKVTVSEQYPRIMFSRTMKKDKAKYFGPYTSSYGVRETIELINKIYKLRTCNRVLPRDRGKDRPCLNYHMKQCSAPCRSDFTEADEAEYAENVKGALDFLNGQYEPVLKSLNDRMEAASERLDFENAAAYRDLIEAVRSVSEKQKITAHDGEDRDVIALNRDREDAVVVIFFVREGRLIGRDHYVLSHVSEDSEDAEVLNDFLGQFYTGTPFVPREIMLEMDVPDKEVIENFLSDKRGSKVSILIPKIGQKERLVELAHRNAGIIMENSKERIKREEGRTIGAAKEIAGWLGLTDVNRMESYDISHISGFDSVGSMVVFEKGKAKKSDYRKFRLSAGIGNNDYESMKEVLTRRFTHEAKSEYDSFSRYPDLILMDGGKGQVHICLEVLHKLGINIPVAGMVKDDKHRTRGIYFEDKEIPIDTRSEGFKLATRIQDEVHRFAIEYHRSLRSVSQVHSVLDEIPGIGPARRKALMRHFGDIGKIKTASIDELCAVEGMNTKAAVAVSSYFKEKQDSGAVQL
ncbi:MAG: excinuclease ABC subunit UvrC [Lachnospiraceae bacterium]|nr:excinuclease ABC subunit UvrC [Lachnospiraceae bacterium]